MVKKEEILKILTDKYVGNPFADDGLNLQFKESYMIVEDLIKRDTPVLVTGEGKKDEWYARWYDCPSCGKKHIIDKSFIFCPICGTRMEHKVK